MPDHNELTPEGDDLVIDVKRLFRIARTIEDKGRDAVSEDDLAWFDSVTEELGKRVHISDEEIAAFRMWKRLPPDVAEQFEDWKLAEFALLWRGGLRNQLYAKGHLDAEDESGDEVG